MNTITIHAHELVFLFALPDAENAWYDLDQAVSASGGATLKLNADREVYACLTDASGKTFYGTVGDETDETLADNFGISAGEEFFFYNHPETETRYI